MLAGTALTGAPAESVAAGAALRESVPAAPAASADVEAAGAASAGGVAADASTPGGCGPSGCCGEEADGAPVSGPWALTWALSSPAWTVSSSPVASPAGAWSGSGGPWITDSARRAWAAWAICGSGLEASQRTRSS